MKKSRIIREPLGIYEARSKFSDLVEQVSMTGEPIVITKHGKPIAELGPPHSTLSLPREPGKAKSSTFFMAEDFDAPLEDFDAYSP